MQININIVHIARWADEIRKGKKGTERWYKGNRFYFYIESATKYNQAMRNNTCLLLFILISLTASAQDKSVLTTHSVALQKIILTDSKGIIRGFDFGETMTAVKEAETVKPEGEGEDYLIYKILFDEGKYAEIEYTFDKNKKLIGIGIAFIENENLSSEELILDDFQNYFNARYGAFKVNEKNDEVWKSSQGYIIEMGDAAEGGNLMEIEIEFYLP